MAKLAFAMFFACLALTLNFCASSTAPNMEPARLVSQSVKGTFSLTGNAYYRSIHASGHWDLYLDADDLKTRFDIAGSFHGRSLSLNLLADLGAKKLTYEYAMGWMSRCGSSPMKGVPENINKSVVDAKLAAFLPTGMNGNDREWVHTQRKGNTKMRFAFDLDHDNVLDTLTITVEKPLMSLTFKMASTTRVLGKPEVSHFQGVCDGGLFDDVDVDDEMEDGVLEDEENSSFLTAIMNLGSAAVGSFAEDSLLSDEEPTEDSELNEEPDEFGDSELSGEPSEDSDDEFGDTDFPEESTQDSDNEFGDSELSEEPTEDSDDDDLSEEPVEEDIASSDKESDKLEEAELHQELPEASSVHDEEAKELDVPESHEQPKEELNVATEHDSTPAEVAMEKKTQDSEVLKVVL